MSPSKRGLMAIARLVVCDEVISALVHTLPLLNSGSLDNCTT